MSGKKPAVTSIIRGITIGTSIALLAACGGQSKLKGRNGTFAQTDYTSSSSFPAPTSSTTSTSGTSTSSGSSGSTSTSTGVSPYSFRVGAVGYTSTTVTVKARKTLKVKFTPGVQDENIAGTGASPQYSGLGLFITVGSSTQATPLLYNGVYGGEVQSATLDFAGKFNSSCSATNPSDENCREEVTITISQPNYNYWCINFGMGCPWSQVSANHPWHGTLSVQTDDTDSL